MKFLSKIMVLFLGLLIMQSCGKEGSDSTETKIKKKTYSLTELADKGIEFRGGTYEYPQITVVCLTEANVKNSEKEKTLRGFLDSLDVESGSTTFAIGEKNFAGWEFESLINRALTALAQEDASSNDCTFILAQTY